jgi:hypothetical protein
MINHTPIAPHLNNCATINSGPSVTSLDFKSAFVAVGKPANTPNNSNGFRRPGFANRYISTDITLD